MYGGNFCLDLSTDRQIILDQFCEIFYAVPAAKIREICEECCWNENLCIEKLSALRRKESQLTTVVPSVSFSNVLRTESGPVTKIPSQESEKARQKRESEEDLPSVYSHVYNKIRMGYKVLILMRGAPGSGKTHLAKSIVKKLMPGMEWKDFVLSADDYFFDSLGRYRYNVEQLDDAHKYCQTRAREKTNLGWSPILIDNTNIKTWEMMPYVQVAVQNGYLIEIIEPTTPWRQSAGKLASKNVHNVTKAKIQRMLDSYEVCTTRDLVSLLKGTAYSNTLPQLRTYPPPATVPLPAPPLQSNPSNENPSDEMETDSNQCVSEDLMQFEKESTPLFESTNIWQSYADSSAAPKSPRTNSRNRQTDQVKAEESKTSIAQRTNSWSETMTSAGVCENASTPLFPTVPAAWQPFEQEAPNFWRVKQSTSRPDDYSTKTEPMSTDQNENCGLLQLLKEGVKSINVPKKEKVEMLDQTEFVRHRVGCDNEHPSFVALRQIYPNKPIDELWDLFTKCSGSVDWAVDILLRDMDSTNSEFVEAQDNYVCGCDMDLMDSARESAFTIKTPQIELNIKPQRSRSARNRAVPQELLETKEAIEKSFVLSDELYSSHVNKIRSKRNGREESSNQKTLVDIQVQTDNDENDSISEDSVDGAELIEMTLGEQLVSQLLAKFQFETPTLTAPEKYKTNVFMPKSLARELLLLWMESVYNQIEEQRQETLKEDEEFARLLKNPKYENCKQSPENIKELLDMEFAWMVYKGEQAELSTVSNPPHTRPTDLASHLTQMKLCELFPNIPKDTLVEILAAHDNKFSDTVETLKDSLQEPFVVDPKAAANVLIEKARDEDLKLDKEAKQQDIQLATTHTEQSSTQRSTRSRSLSPEEAKRLALKEFEETRNYAVHHCQLRAECYQKAKEAIQRGNSGVAVYYSSIANLHKKKIDVYNHRAANCIIEVHDLTQNNPDFIDLHYLHVIEAIACLDIFIDKHISKLRSQFRSYKYVFIITGRGLHSMGGVSTIKTRVKSRLKERNLKWTEVNPGLLKVKIFSATKYAKNL